MSNEEFTASNGVKIRHREGYTPLECSHHFLGWTEVTQCRPTSDLGVALVEYFRHKEDERLGRWRWTNPDDGEQFLVRKLGYGDVFRVTTEATQETLDWGPGQYKGDRYANAAHWLAIRAYLAVHPEKKPWHDAKPGEVWVLRVLDESEERPYTVGDTGFTGEDIRGEYWGAVPVESHVFTNGRRIWPESKETTND